MKTKKHERITKDPEKAKRKHLEKLADKMLEKDEELQKLKSYKLKKNPFDFFK
jgi:hypothetical protein